MKGDLLTDERFMRLALAEARSAFEKGEVPVGALVVQDGKVIGRGHNQVETLGDPTAHAEMLALSAAFGYLNSKYLPEATLYVTVEPCVMCAGALYWARPAAVVFGAPDAKNGYGRCCTHPFHPRTILRKGVLAGECAALMQEFFRGRR